MSTNYRPVFHFSPQRGWMNDPNGLVWHKGLWHMFYQYMPTETHWGPMHWGHAVSRDLRHWEDRPIALFPDQLGTIFSGSAAVLGKDAASDELVACFTQANVRTQVQSLAFSHDGGNTWEKYEHNPVLVFDRLDFRDPKIFRRDDLWHMVIAAGSEAQIYVSPDLTNWTLRSSFSAPLPDWTWECPDLFELGKQWVLTGSFIRSGVTPIDAYGSYYWVGDFDGITFTPQGGPQPLTFGPDDYAAVSWSDVADERRVIIGWMSQWTYAPKTPTENEGWRGMMTLPRELSLANGLLKQNPPRELNNWRGVKISFNEGQIPFAGDAYEIEAEIGLAKLQESHVGFRLRVGEGEATEVRYDVERGELCIDRTQSGQVDFHSIFAGTFRAPLAIQDDVLKLRIFVDRCSVEVFAQDGMLYGGTLIFPSPESRGIEFFGEGARIECGAIYPYDDSPIRVR